MFVPLPVAALLCWAAPALSAPLPLVVVLPGEVDTSAAAGLAEALRIQLGTKGNVSVGAALTGTTVSARIREATQALGSMDASLAVWVEQEASPEGTQVVLYGVSREGGRTVVETLQAPPENRAAIERMLAVKVAELLRGPRAPVPLPVAPAKPLSHVDSPPAEPPAPVASPPPARAAAWLATLGLWGALPTPGAGTRVGFLAGSGLRLDGASSALEFFATGRLISTAVIDDPDGHLTVGELDFTIGARWLRVWDGISLGAGVEGEGWILRGFPSGLAGQGSQWELVPAVSGSVEVRARLLAGVEARVGAGAAVPLRTARFTVASREFLNYGHLRPMADVSLVFRAH